MAARALFLLFSILLIAAALGSYAREARTAVPIFVAQGGTYSDPQSSQPKAAEGQEKRTLSPQEKMRRRFPQPVKVADLISLPVLDGRHSTIGYVRQVVRTDAGKIELIVNNGWFFGRGGPLIALPIEVAVSLGRQIVPLDMPRQEFDSIPIWTASTTRSVADDEIIKIAVAHRWSN